MGKRRAGTHTNREGVEAVGSKLQRRHRGMDGKEEKRGGVKLRKPLIFIFTGDSLFPLVPYTF